MFVSPLVPDAGLSQHPVCIRSDTSHPEEIGHMIDYIHEEVIYMIEACCTVAHLLSGL